MAEKQVARIGGRGAGGGGVHQAGGDARLHDQFRAELALRSPLGLPTNQVRKGPRVRNGVTWAIRRRTANGLRSCRSTNAVRRADWSSVSGTRRRRTHTCSPARTCCRHVLDRVHHLDTDGVERTGLDQSHAAIGTSEHDARMMDAGSAHQPVAGPRRQGPIAGQEDVARLRNIRAGRRGGRLQVEHRPAQVTGRLGLAPLRRRGPPTRPGPKGSIPFILRRERRAQLVQPLFLISRLDRLA